MTARKIYRTLAFASMLFGSSACVSSTGPAEASGEKPPRDETTLDRAFAPMQEKAEILADRLDVDMSAELFVRGIYPSSSSGAHRVKRSSGPPVEWVYSNSSGVSRPIELHIGAVKFWIVERARIRLHRKGTARFELLASGNIAVKRPDEALRKTDRLRVTNGRWHW
ncbi:MAG: hypothetical protein ACE5F1_15935 [Planctomycetota bacterium]